MVISGRAACNRRKQLRAGINIFGAQAGVAGSCIFSNHLVPGVDVPGRSGTHDFLDALMAKIRIYSRGAVNLGESGLAVIGVSGSGIMGHVACVVISIAAVGDLVGGRIDHQGGLANRKVGVSG